MQKLFLLALFALILSSPVHAEEGAVAALEAEADNLAVTPPERRAKILDSANKKNHYRVNNYSEKKKKNIVKFSNQLDKRYKRINKKEYQKPEAVDVKNEIDMKYFFNRHVNID